MTREPIFVAGEVTGHNVTTDPVYTTIRDMRGYESIVLLHWPTTVFEPIKRQRGILDED